MGVVADMKDSVVRTVTPYVVGFIMVKAAERGLDWDAEQVTGAVTVAAGSVYYVFARLLEDLNPKMGVLLGVAKKPAYPEKSALKK
jgi:hypothetical protein